MACDQSDTSMAASGKSDAAANAGGALSVSQSKKKTPKKLDSKKIQQPTPDSSEVDGDGDVAQGDGVDAGGRSQAQVETVDEPVSQATPRSRTQSRRRQSRGRGRRGGSVQPDSDVESVRSEQSAAGGRRQRQRQKKQLQQQEQAQQQGGGGVLSGLDMEIQLKANIYGDLTLGLLN